MADVFLGLDVTTGGRPFSYGVVAGSRVNAESGESISGVLEVGWIESSVADIVALVQRIRPRVTAIDCPRGVPTGQNLACCFVPNSTCSCRITGTWNGRPQTMRQAEHELMSMGISLYSTSKNSEPSWKALVLAMSPVWQQLALITDVIESYPYGIWRRLFLQSPFAWRGGVKNDSYDAVLCGVVAERHHQRASEAFGLASEGQIVLPG